MNIIWQYLDKRSAAINALKDYHSMQFIIDHTDEEIREVHNDMTSIRGVQYDGMPKTHNPFAGEDKILKAIEEVDVLKERYRQALEYMEWFRPAWEQLSEEERYVLDVFYRDEDGQTGAVYDICDHFHIERSTAYNRKNRAVNHLATLLFGKA